MGLFKWEQILLCLHCRKGLAALEEYNDYLNKEYYLLFLGHVHSKKVLLFFVFFLFWKGLKHCCDDTACATYAPLQIDPTAGMRRCEFRVTCRPCSQHICAIVGLSGLPFCFWAGREMLSDLVRVQRASVWGCPRPLSEPPPAMTDRRASSMCTSASDVTFGSIRLFVRRRLRFCCVLTWLKDWLDRLVNNKDLMYILL